MAKFLLVCTRTGEPPPAMRIARACRLLSPDHLGPAPPELLERPGLTLAIASPSPLVARHGTSACLGQMLVPGDGWSVPGGTVPDGTYALVRSDEERVELLTDAVGSRSVYCAHTGDLFVASSSQRAIVSVLGNFTLSERALPWILSAGSLGPEATWDDRIFRLGADTRVTLDRRGWTLERRARPIAFAPERLRARDHAALLRDAVRSVCDRLDLGGAEWRLPLSGGYDSRALLLHLAPRVRIPCITWGVARSLDDPRSDAAVARALACALGIPHEYFSIDASSEPLDAIFDRFLANGEGCVDHIGAYMDGFELWRRLHQSGVAGIVRGDEGFGWEQVALEADVRRVVGAAMLTDFYPRERLSALGLVEQTWPAALARGPHESLATWRDRLYHAYRIPVVLAALTELKAPYVEIVNPLLSRQILEVVRALPDALRTEKLLFREVVMAMGPPIPIATRSAIADIHLLALTRPFLELAHRELLAGRDAGVLPAPFAEYLLATLPDVARPDQAQRAPRGKRAGRTSAWLGRLLPRAVRSVVRRVLPRPPSVEMLAFRASIVSRMARDLARASAP